MGCVPVIMTFTDARCTAVVFFWFVVTVLLWHTAVCSGTAQQRYFCMFYFALVVKMLFLIGFISLLCIEHCKCRQLIEVYFAIITKDELI